jgi:hypothetical protein
MTTILRGAARTVEESGPATLYRSFAHQWVRPMKKQQNAITIIITRYDRLVKKKNVVAHLAP